MTIGKEIEREILRLFHVEKWTVTTIATQLDIHHSTVKRVLQEDGLPVDKILVRSSMADRYIPFVKEMLEKYPKLTATRLHEMVNARGYEGQVRHFRNIIARHRPQPKAEAFLRLRTLPGEEAQCDC